MGIGGAIPAYLLGMVGFDSSLPQQPDAVKQMIIVCVLIVPALFTVVGAVIMGAGYPLGKEALEKQIEQMDKIHGKA